MKCPKCNKHMEYNIPRDEMAPPYLECECGYIEIAPGQDPLYYEDEL
jgi:hypothetical protein